MKFGYRTPSFKKSFSARTTGRYKRAAKRAINPYYGRKGAGWINNPRKATYNKIYNKTTKSIFDTSVPSQSHDNISPNPKEIKDFVSQVSTDQQSPSEELPSEDNIEGYYDDFGNFRKYTHDEYGKFDERNKTINHTIKKTVDIDNDANRKVKPKIPNRLTIFLWIIGIIFIICMFIFATTFTLGIIFIAFIVYQLTSK